MSLIYFLWRVLWDEKDFVNDKAFKFIISKIQEIWLLKWLLNWEYFIIDTKN